MTSLPFAHLTRPQFDASIDTTLLGYFLTEDDKMFIVHYENLAQV